MTSSADALVPDACVLINVYATGLFEEMARHLPYQLVVAEETLAEALFIRDVDQETGLPTRLPIDLEPHLASGLLGRAALSAGTELLLFRELAAHLGDGEAAAIAIAATRGFALATDDRKARRLAARVAPALGLYGTATLLREAIQQMGIAPGQGRDVLRAVRRRAQFEPPPDDPDRPWWEALLGEESTGE